MLQVTLIGTVSKVESNKVKVLTISTLDSSKEPKEMVITGEYYSKDEVSAGTYIISGDLLLNKNVFTMKVSSLTKTNSKVGIVSTVLSGNVNKVYKSDKIVKLTINSYAGKDASMWIDVACFSAMEILGKQKESTPLILTGKGLEVTSYINKSGETVLKLQMIMNSFGFISSGKKSNGDESVSNKDKDDLGF
jgi:hypothetical protein